MVNAFDADQLAMDADININVSSELSDLNGDCDAVLCDIDSFPREERRELLNRLIDVAASIPVAVHSYGLTEAEADELSQQGIPVFRRLDSESFMVMLLAMLPVSSASGMPSVMEQKPDLVPATTAAGQP